MRDVGTNGAEARAFSVHYEGSISKKDSAVRPPATAELTTIALSCQAPSRGGGRVCGAGLGESVVRVRLIGVFRRWDERQAVAGPRDVRRCRKCGWYNISEPVLDTESSQR